ncbi:hypothetical protein Patl1_03703 [Pistacia atlantica]|uniref:Uncharacterized protein n=1 Tax=Pistacia atlantica TaxID=434234 RepID=A0ACC1BQE4_9ROSI|nr:hypothetical protein Patl1_03703 [Pistacia atlantica]
MFFLVLSLVSLVIGLTSAADPTYLSHNCPNTTTFNRNSTYQSNLNFLLSSLVSNATSNGFFTGFYNATAGQYPDKVYALFLCRGDVTPSACQDCVSFATSDILKRCPVQKESIIWYDPCLLRYSGESIFSTVDSNPGVILYNTNNVTEPVRFNQQVRTTMKEAANEAVASPKKFSTRKANFTTIQTLQEQEFCFPSCCSHFELYPFYNENVPAAPPPTPVLSSPPSVSVTRPKGKTGMSSSIIIAIIAPIVVAVAWKHWRDGTPLQLLDSTLIDSYSRNEVIRCIHMGLLCVQEDPADRPTMAKIVFMLNSYSVTLPAPQQPAFFLGSRMEASMPTMEFDFNKSKSKSIPSSVHDASITEFGELKDPSSYIDLILANFIQADVVGEGRDVEILTLYEVVLKQKLKGRASELRIKMPSLKFFMFFLVLYLATSAIGSTSAADPKYLFHDCTNTTTFNRNSTYQSNLNFLLSSLVSNATRSNGFSTGFYNATAGQDPDKVYALFLCRGDVNPTTCQECVNFATSDILQRCPVQKESIIWYDPCLLRYSGEYIFSTMKGNPGAVFYDSNNVTEQVRFNLLVGTTMKEAANEAVASPKKFSSRKANFTTIQTLYCLVQCTPDLSNLDCNNCLEQSFATLPTTRVGARVLIPSCNSRFELYPFYNETVTDAPPPTPALSSSPPKGNSGISSSIIIAIIAPIVVAVVLFIAGYCLLIMRARKKNSPPLEDNGLETLEGWDTVATEDSADRPSMATIVLMLNSYSVTLPAPRRPAFFLGTRREASMATNEFDFDQSKSNSIPWSVDDASITEVYPR